MITAKNVTLLAAKSQPIIIKKATNKKTPTTNDRKKKDLICMR